MRIAIPMYLWMGLLGFNPVFAQTPKDFSTNFEFDLKLSVDATKRAAYLKKMNEHRAPTRRSSPSFPVVCRWPMSLIK